MKLSINKIIELLPIVILPIFLFSINLGTWLKVSFLIFLLFCMFYKQRGFLHISIDSFLFTIFMICYSTFFILNDYKEWSQNISNLLFIILCYFIGLNLKLKNENRVYIINCISILSLSLIALISIYKDIIVNGFEQNSRSIDYFYRPGSSISATVMGGYLYLSTVAASFIFFKNKYRILYILYSLIVFFAVIRLGSRTLSILLIINLIIGYITFFKFSIGQIILTLISIFFSIRYIYLNQQFLLTYFNDRLDDSQSGFGTAGGRLEKWSYALNTLLEHPLGWELSKNGHAHNIFLDAARLGGILSSVILVIWFFFIFKKFINRFFIFRFNYSKAFYLSFFMVALISFNVEPILDGFAYFLATYLFILGCAEANKNLILK